MGFKGDNGFTGGGGGGAALPIPLQGAIALADIYFVDNQNASANNATALKGSIYRPYKTIEAAIALASVGDYIVLLSDCEVGDNGVDTVNNIFKNGITITDLGLGVTVSYNGAYAGWIVNINSVTNVDFNILGNITFVNKAEIASSGCIRVNGCTNGNVVLQYNKAISFALTVSLTSNSFTKTDSNFNLICNENMVDVTAAKTWRTAAILSETNNGGAMKNYNIVCQTAKNIHGGGLIASDCVVTSQDSNANVEVKNIVSNSEQNYVVLLGLTNSTFKNDIINSTSTASSGVVLFNPMASSVVNFGDITVSNSTVFLSNYNNTGAIDTYVYFNKIVSSGSANCVRFTPSNVLFTGTKIENTGGGAAIDITFGANGTSILGNYDIRQLISNSVNATVLVNYGIAYATANSDYKTRFIGDVRIENTGTGAAIGRNTNAFAISHTLLFDAQVSLITDSGFPVNSNISVSNQTNLYFLAKQDGYVNNNFENTVVSSLVWDITIDDAVFSGTLLSSTLLTNYTFKLNLNVGNGGYSYTKFFASGTTREVVRDTIISELNTLFNASGAETYTLRGIETFINFAANSTNITATNTNADFFFLTNSGLADNGFSGIAISSGDGIFSNLNTSIFGFIYNANISDII
jgi:hypothetical protein